MSQNNYIFNILDFFYKKNIYKKFLEKFENLRKMIVIYEMRTKKLSVMTYNQSNNQML
jgi:hypothetical protein